MEFEGNFIILLVFKGGVFHEIPDNFRLKNGHGNH